MSEAVAIVLLVGRVIFAIQFVSGGLAHFKAGGQMVAYARAMGAPAASLGGWPAGVWMLAAGLSVALGIWPDVGALMIALWGIPTAYYIHGWWRYDDEQQKQNQQVVFMRNVAFIGGAIALFAAFVAFGDDLRYSITAPLFDF
ncbi:MAG: DoxX family protein [Acidimicrobiia bacterium]